MSNARGASREVLHNPAAEYYEEAVSAFLALFDSEYGVTTRPVDRIQEVNRALRICILFAALAAEAYVNGFMALVLTADALAELDREPSARKYVLAPEHATGEAQLDLSRAPLQVLTELFKRRDRIVHARPERIKTIAYGVMIEPTECARSLVAVGECVISLSDSLEDAGFMGPVERMWDLGDEIDPDEGQIEAERTYYFTGGLPHVIVEHEVELVALAAGLEADPLTGGQAPVLEFIALGHEREMNLLRSM